MSLYDIDTLGQQRECGLFFDEVGNLAPPGATTFSADLLTSATPQKGSFDSFVRNTTATFKNSNGYIEEVLPNEIRFNGATRIINALPFSEGVDVNGASPFDTLSMGSVGRPRPVAPDGTNTAYSFQTLTGSLNQIAIHDSAFSGVKQNVLSFWARVTATTPKAIKFYNLTAGILVEVNVDDVWRLYSLPVFNLDLDTSIIIGFTRVIVDEGFDLELWHPCISFDNGNGTCEEYIDAEANGLSAPYYGTNVVNTKCTNRYPANTVNAVTRIVTEIEGALIPSVADDRRGYLWEDESTNLIKSSNQIVASGFWSLLDMPASETHDQPDPMGGESAALAATASSAAGSVLHGFSSLDLITTTADSQNLCFSGFFKADSSDKVLLAISGTDSSFCNYVFDLTNETATLLSAPSVYTDTIGIIEPYADGWYRCSVQVVSGTGIFDHTAGFYLHDTAGQIFFDDSVSSGSIQWYGMQFEQNYRASSYIETIHTEGVIVTRDRDILRFDKSAYNHDEGILFSAYKLAENVALNTQTTALRIIAQFGYNAADQNLELTYNKDTDTHRSRAASNGSVFNESVTDTDLDADIKALASWKQDSFKAAWSIAGSLDEDFAGNLPDSSVFTTFIIGSGNENASSASEGTMKELKVYKKQLADDKLLELVQ